MGPVADHQTIVSRLAPLETFDSNAFVGDATFPQSVCDFVLAMALVYNDFRDVIVARSLLQSITPEGNPLTTERGEVAGRAEHLDRLLAGIVHELTELIRNNISVIESPELLRVIGETPRGIRSVWSEVVTVGRAGGRGLGSDPLSRLIFFARNKVAYHYDPKIVARGYRRAFMEDPTRFPLVSRGPAMEKTRFYFADAAAQSFLRSGDDSRVANDFFSAEDPLLAQVNHALREIVIAFLKKRGLRPVPAPTT